MGDPKTMLNLIFLLLLTVAFIDGESNFTNPDDFVIYFEEKLNASTTFVDPVNNTKLLGDNEDPTIYGYGTFDFVIIGSGSAGSLLTRRLTEIEQFNVLLLEAGGPGDDFSDVPGAAGYLQKSDMNWGYLSTPQVGACQGMLNKQCVVPRGKVVGGSSTINGKMYVRGNKRDFDLWSEMGNEGWSYDQILPYFLKTEHSEIDDADKAYHNTFGILNVTHVESTIFRQVYGDGMRELGIEEGDYNGENQFRSSRIQFNINGIKAYSGERAFLDPIMKRTNLNLTTNAFVTQLLIDNNKKAYGVQFVKDGKKYVAKAAKEVILSAGTINSPQILMLSGIGPKQQLESLGIEVIADLPAVGQNMQDHPIFVGFIVRTNLTFFNDTLEKQVKDYLNGHRPLIAPFNGEMMSFHNLNSQANAAPDFQITMYVPPGLGTSRRPYNLDNATSTQFVSNYNPFSDLLLVPCLLHQKSRGSVTLKSSDPVDFPNINYNYLNDPEGKDIETLYKAVQEIIKLLDTKSFRAVNATYQPIVANCEEYEELSKEYWYCAIRHLTSTVYHPVGTTRMGQSVKNSVVNNKGIVHGLKSLRVIDAGIMPEITSGNINAPTFMIAEKLSDDIKRYYNVLK